MLLGTLGIILLAAACAYCTISEMSLAASSKMKLHALVDKGSVKAQRILKFQDQPGLFFTTVQIVLNFVTILAGIVGDATFAPIIFNELPESIPLALRNQIASAVPFIGVTVFFVLFADQLPKRVAMAMPEKCSQLTIDGMRRFIFICGPFARALNFVSGGIYKLLGFPEKRDNITSDDLYAVVEEGTMAGLLRKQEKDLIGNVFELDVRTVPSAMTARENIVYFDLHEDEASIKEKITRESHSTYLVCDKEIDKIIGYVDSKVLLERVVKGQTLTLDGDLKIRPPLILPDTLTLAEAMDYFKGKGEDLAVVLNEYALVVGIITLQDIMQVLIGDLVGEGEQITRRDEKSLLFDGATPIDDVEHVLDINEFPDEENYETLGGFMTYSLRRIPRKNDHMTYHGYKFEVMDVENYKIGQILVTRLQGGKESAPEAKAIKK